MIIKAQFVFLKTCAELFLKFSLKLSLKLILLGIYLIKLLLINEGCFGTIMHIQNDILPSQLCTFF